MSSKLIGIDFGLAKIGLSISDPSKIISIPLKVVRYKTKNEPVSYTHLTLPTKA